MALSAADVWEVRTTGADTNGGAFKAGASGTDFSQQNAAQSSGTDLAVDATTNTKVTSAGHSFAATDVGNVIQITAGTGFTTGFYEVVSVAAGAATLDRSPAAVGVTGGTWALGGALATLTKAAGAVVAGNTVYAKASANYNETFTVTTTAGTSPLPITWVGYTTTRTDAGPATVDGQNTRAACMTVNKNGHVFKNFVFTGAATRCVDNTAGGLNLLRFENCQFLKGSGAGNLGFDSSTFSATLGTFVNCLWNGFATNAATRFSCLCLDCEFVNCGPAASTTFAGTALFYRCLFRGGAGPGIDMPGNDNNVTIDNCTFYGKSSGSGVRFGGTTYNFCRVTNNLFAGNAAYGLDAPNEAGVYANWNAYYGNTSGARNVIAAGPNDVTLTADPFTNAAGGDLSLNNTAGGGAACRAAGYPGLWPAGLTRGYPDVGAAQSQAAAGAAGGGKLLRSFIIEAAA